MENTPEEVILAILLFNDNIEEKQINYIFEFIDDEMFLNNLNKKTYQIFKQVYETDKEIFKTPHFIKKICQIATLEEDENFALYIKNLENQWSPTPTINYWIEKLQQNYFNQKYKCAKTKKEFKQILEYEQKYSIKIQTEDNTIEAQKDLEEYEKRKQTAITTNFKSIDKCIGSLQGGDMIILAGSTGSGKTCFMLNLALKFAKQNKTIDIFSLEMPPYQLRQRLVCIETLIDANKFRSFTLDEEDRKTYSNYIKTQYPKLKFNINKKQNVTMDLIKKSVLKSNSDIVIIDYLGLISTNTNKGTYDKFSDISREIKLLAIESNKPIIALHQLNRSFMERDDKKPRTSDLRDSGKIEQDADMIWFVYRPYLFDNTKSESDMYFILAKNRFGTTNKEVKLFFDGKHQKILERGL